jgi:hypothetical protein
VEDWLLREGGTRRVAGVELLDAVGSATERVDDYRGFRP